MADLRTLDAKSRPPATPRGSEDGFSVTTTIDQRRVDEFETLVKECEGLQQQLDSLAQADLLHVPRDSHYHGFRTKSTVRCSALNFVVVWVELASHHTQRVCCPQVGMMLSGLMIDGMVVGGPAFVSHQLDRGDEIVRVDGVTVTTDDFQEKIIGVDIPGTHVTVTVRKYDTVSLLLLFCLLAIL